MSLTQLRGEGTLVRMGGLQGYHMEHLKTPASLQRRVDSGGAPWALELTWPGQWEEPGLSTWPLTQPPVLPGQAGHSLDLSEYPLTEINMS